MNDIGHFIDHVINKVWSTHLVNHIMLDLYKIDLSVYEELDFNPSFL